MIVYWLMIAGGIVILLWLAMWHQYLLPQERALIRPQWEPTHINVPEGPERVEVAGEQIICTCRDGNELVFKAPGTRLALGSLAFVTVNNQRVLAVLDRGRRHRVYLVDIYRAAEKGNLFEAVIGWWRHGTGWLLAADGEHLLEVHRCFGRDRIYLVDPALALQGTAFGLGIQRTLIAPVRRLGGVRLHDRTVYISAGHRRWQTELF